MKDNMDYFEISDYIFIYDIYDDTDDKALIDFAQKLLRLMKLAKEDKTVAGFYF